MPAFVVSASTPESDRHYFAPLTRAMRAYLRELRPSARDLFIELRTWGETGRELEVYLDELAQRMDYSLRTLQNAVKELQSAGLLKIVKRWTSKAMKLTLSEDFWNKISESGKFVAKRMTSNPYPVVPPSKDLKEASTEGFSAAAAAKSSALAAAVSESEQKGFSGRLDEPLSEEIRAIEPETVEEPEIDRMRAAQLDRVQSAIAPEFLHPKLKAFILSHTYERVERNLDRIITRKRNGKVSSAAALLVDAIKRDYARPVEVETRGRVVPDGFGEWFTRARAAGLVRASQLVNGIQLVLTSRDVWQPWEELREAYPLNSLPPA